jgi:hypothetical protein
MCPIEDGVERGFIGKEAIRADALQRFTIQLRDSFLDVAAAAADTVRNNEDLSAAAPITFTIDAQPDVPRTIAWSLTHTNITKFSLTILGTDAKGETVTETFSQADGWSGETSNAYATITSITLDSRTGTGATDTCDVGCGSKLGLSNNLQAATSIIKITKNKADYPAASYTVDADYDTVDVSTGAAIVADDDFTITYRRCLDSCDAIA